MTTTETNKIFFARVAGGVEAYLVLFYRSATNWQKRSRHNNSGGSRKATRSESSCAVAITTTFSTPNSRHLCGGNTATGDRSRTGKVRGAVNATLKNSVHATTSGASTIRTAAPSENGKVEGYAKETNHSATKRGQRAIQNHTATQSAIPAKVMRARIGRAGIHNASKRQAVTPKPTVATNHSRVPYTTSPKTNGHRITRTTTNTSSADLRGNGEYFFR